LPFRGFCLEPTPSPPSFQKNFVVPAYFFFRVCCPWITAGFLLLGGTIDVPSFFRLFSFFRTGHALHFEETVLGRLSDTGTCPTGKVPSPFLLLGYGGRRIGRPFPLLPSFFGSTRQGKIGYNPFPFSFVFFFFQTKFVSPGSFWSNRFPFLDRFQTFHFPP